MLHKLILSLVVVASGFQPWAADATPIPLELDGRDVNTLVALEATQEALLLAALHIDQPYINSQSLGGWSGTIDADGWSLAFVGAVNGVPLSINQSGGLDLSGGKASWTNTVLFGGNPYSGSGAIFFDPSWTELLFGVAVIGVQALNATTVVGAVAGGIVSFVLIYGESALEEAGADLKGKIEKKSGQVTQISSDMRVLSSTFAPDPLLDVRFVQDGFQDPATGFTTFEARTIPEPTLLMLLGAAVLASACSLSLGRVGRSDSKGG